MTSSTWGDPTATKHALLIHGLMGSSRVWHHIACDFASRGYYVTAPDLLGHGNAPRAEDYTVAALVEALRPFLTAPGAAYDAVVGHSLGGVVAAGLFPFLGASTRPVRVVLVDPPFYVDPELKQYHRKLFGDMVRNPTTPEEYLKEHPRWTKEDATLAYLSVRACEVATVEAIIDQNDPWSFAYYLSGVPDNVRVTVLAADPAQNALVREDEVKAYPRVTARTIWGASHSIPSEVPEVVVEAALESIAESQDETQPE